MKSHTSTNKYSIMNLDEAIGFLKGKTLVHKGYKDKETCDIVSWYDNMHEIRLIRANGLCDISFIVPEHMVIALAMGEEVLGYRVKELI